METALKEAGSCGRFQVCHVIFTQLPRFATLWGVMVMMFGVYDPGWRCIAGIGLESTDSKLHTRYHGNESTVQYYGKYNNGSNGNYLVDGGNFDDRDVKGNDSVLNNYNGTCEEFEYCQDVEFDTVSVTIVSEFKLICSRKWIVRAILLLQSVGFLAGALLGGQIGEKYGRKVSLYSGTFIMFLFSSLAIFSFHWTMYAFCLFLLGLGSNIVLSTSNVFSMEFLNSKWRSFFGSIPVWNVSLCIFTLSTAVMRSWIHVHIVTAIISLVACIGYFLLPESLRWLVVNGRKDEAKRVIHKVAKMNRKRPPSADVLQTLEEESKQEREGSYTYLDLFRTRQLVILTVKFTLIFISMFITYLALGYGVAALPGDYYINAIASSVCEMVVVLLTGPLCNKIGRRWSGCVMSILGAVSCLTIVVALYTTEGNAQSLTVKSSAFLARSGSQGMIIVATIFMAELFPTAVRIVAFGLFRATSGIGGLVAPFLIPTEGVNSFAICFSLMSALYFLSMILFLSLSETNRLCLLDTIGEHSKREARKESDC